jgi:hypothetical protein
LVQITGPSGTPMFDQYTQRASMKWFSMALGDFVDVTNTGAAVANKEGYFVFVRGDRAVAVGGTTGATTLRMRGQILRNDQTFNITANKFLSVGNPYASRIDFRTVTKNTIVEAFTVWNPNNLGSYNVGKYETYVKELSAPFDYKLNGIGAVRNYIESGEAFLIQSTTNGSLVIKESDKADGSSVVSRVGTSTIPALEINLFTKAIDGTPYLADAVLLNFDTNFNNGFDNLDVKKVANAADNLSIKNGSLNLSVERRSLLSITDTIQLLLANTRIANYTIKISPNSIDHTAFDLYVIDKFLHTETRINLDDDTDINFDITTDAGSRVTDRFIIVARIPLVYASVFTKIKANRNADKSVWITWDVEKEKNVLNQVVEHSTDGVSFSLLGNKLPVNNGLFSSYNYTDVNASQKDIYYRIKSVRANGSFVYSDIVKVAALENSHNIIVSPNPILDKQVYFTLNNMPFGDYTVEVISETGSKVIQTSLTHLTHTKVYSIKLTQLASGNYHLHVYNSQTKQVELIFIQ